MRASTRIDYQARIDRVLLWLDAHRDEAVTPAEAASVAAFSPYHFHRVFRGVTGESLMQCLRRLRLESAARRLRYGDESVTDIAFGAGFDSHEGFTRAFKAHFGVAPSVWRSQESARRVEALAEALPIPTVEVRDVPAQTMICMRHQGDFGDVGAVWARFLGLAGQAGLYRGTEQLIGCYPDDPDVTPAGLIRFDVGLVETDRHVGDLPAALRREVVPAGRWAVCVHAGSYDTLSATYLRLVGGYFPSAGLGLADRPCMEVYRNTPVDTADADLRTEVWAPVSARHST